VPNFYNISARISIRKLKLGKNSLAAVKKKGLEKKTGAELRPAYFC